MIRALVILWLVCAWCAPASAETLKLANGDTITGEIVEFLTCGGQPDEPTVLAIVRAGGVPVVYACDVDAFNSRGKNRFSTSVAF